MGPRHLRHPLGVARGPRRVRERGDELVDQRVRVRAGKGHAEARERSLHLHRQQPVEGRPRVQGARLALHRREVRVRVLERRTSRRRRRRATPPPPPPPLASRRSRRGDLDMVDVEGHLGAAVERLSSVKRPLGSRWTTVPRACRDHRVHTAFVTICEWWLIASTRWASSITPRPWCTGGAAAASGTTRAMRARRSAPTRAKVASRNDTRSASSSSGRRTAAVDVEPSTRR